MSSYTNNIDDLPMQLIMRDYEKRDFKEKERLMLMLLSGGLTKLTKTVGLCVPVKEAGKGVKKEQFVAQRKAEEAPPYKPGKLGMDVVYKMMALVLDLLETETKTNQKQAMQSVEIGQAEITHLQGEYKKIEKQLEKMKHRHHYNFFSSIKAFFTGHFKEWGKMQWGLIKIVAYAYAAEQMELFAGVAYVGSAGQDKKFNHKVQHESKGLGNKMIQNSSFQLLMDYVSIALAVMTGQPELIALTVMFVALGDTGKMDALTTDIAKGLAKHMSKKAARILADVIVAIIVLVATAGASASGTAIAAKVGVRSAAQAAAKEATEEAASAVAKATIAQAAVQALSGAVGEEATKQALMKVAEEATKTAVEATAKAEVAQQAAQAAARQAAVSTAAASGENSSKAEGVQKGVKLAIDAEQQASQEEELASVQLGKAQEALDSVEKLQATMKEQITEGASSKAILRTAEEIDKFSSQAVLAQRAAEAAQVTAEKSAKVCELILELVETEATLVVKVVAKDVLDAGTDALEKVEQEIGTLQEKVEGLNQSIKGAEKELVQAQAGMKTAVAKNTVPYKDILRKSFGFGVTAASMELASSSFVTDFLKAIGKENNTVAIVLGEIAMMAACLFVGGMGAKFGSAGDLLGQGSSRMTTNMRLGMGVLSTIQGGAQVGQGMYAIAQAKSHREFYNAKAMVDLLKSALDANHQTVKQQEDQMKGVTAEYETAVEDMSVIANQNEGVARVLAQHA